MNRRGICRSWMETFDRACAGTSCATDKLSRTTHDAPPAAADDVLSRSTYDGLARQEFHETSKPLFV